MVETIQVPETATFEAMRQRLAQVNVDQAALELPEGWLELDNAARMRLLQRQAQIQAMDVAIISRHEPTRQAAKAVGMPVFRRAEDAVSGNWSMDPNLPPVDVANPAATLPEAPPWRREDIVTRAARPTQHRARQRRIDAEERYRKPTPAWVRLGGNLAMGAIIAGALLLFALYVLPAATITVVPGRDAGMAVPLRLPQGAPAAHRHCDGPREDVARGPGHDTAHALDRPQRPQEHPRRNRHALHLSRRGDPRVLHA